MGDEGGGATGKVNRGGPSTLLHWSLSMSSKWWGPCYIFIPPGPCTQQTHRSSVIPSWACSWPPGTDSLGGRRPLTRFGGQGLDKRGEESTTGHDGGDGACAGQRSWPGRGRGRMTQGKASVHTGTGQAVRGSGTAARAPRVVAGEIGNPHPHLQEPGDSGLRPECPLVCQLARVSSPFN